MAVALSTRELFCSRFIAGGGGTQYSPQNFSHFFLIRDRVAGTRSYLLCCTGKWEGSCEALRPRPSNMNAAGLPRPGYRLPSYQE